MIFSRVDPVTGETNQMDLPITQEQLLAWQRGELIQNAMPNLSPDEREFIISGCMPSSFDKLFGEE